jgi:magnesium transporter
MRDEDLLLESFLESHPEDAALILERLPSQELAELFEGDIPPAVSASVLQRINPMVAAESLALTTRDRAGEIVVKLPLHVAAVLLRRMNPEIRDGLLKRLPHEATRPLGLLLQYPENTAGSLMEPRVLVLPSDMTVSDAIALVRRSPHHAIHYFYVVDRRQILAGVTTLRELMLARPKDLVSSVMRTPAVHLSFRADRAAIVNHTGWKSFHKLPVTDDTGVFLGVIGYKTLRTIEARRTTPDWTQGALSITLILGEVYWTGVSAALQSLNALMRVFDKQRNQ